MPRSARPLVSLVALVALLAVASIVSALAPDARAEPPLRRRTPLLPLLDEGAVAPPLVVRQAALEACIPSLYPNMWSPLPEALRKAEQRVTLSTFPGGKFELRDALLVPVPRRMSFELTAPEEARLDFEYHLFACGHAIKHVTMRVTIEDANGTSEQVVPLPPQKPGEPRWSTVSLELPVAAEGAFRLTLAFEVPRAEAGAVLAWAEPAVSGRPPGELGPADTNVLWIVIDSARSDALGPARAFPSPTPNLDRLFGDGTAFSQAYAMSNQTRTSTTAMLGSVHPSIGGFQPHDWEFAKNRLKNFYRDRPPLVTELLAAAGWRVAHIGDNIFLWGSNPSGVDAGFPHIDDYRVDEQDARLVTEGAAAFAEAHRAERWFLMLEYLAPHTPYQPPHEWQAAADALPGESHLGPEHHLPRSYVGELMWVDKNVADLIARLDALDLTQRTLVIVTADHGEVMLRWHDCASARVKLRCGYNHSVTVYDDELHVPLTFHLPGRVASGRVIDTPVSHADIVPTILDLVGLPPAPGMAGRSILEALEGGPLAPAPIYADGRLASALRDGEWKLIVHAPDDDAATRARYTKEGGEYAREELFDLSTDPDETTNLSSARPEVLQSMLAKIASVRAELAQRFAPAVVAP
ncbi:MAG: sulfatase [Myxococcota bacterium]